MCAQDPVNLRCKRSKKPEKHAVEINSLLFNTLLSHSPFKEDKLYNIWISFSLLASGLLEDIVSHFW